MRSIFWTAAALLSCGACASAQEPATPGQACATIAEPWKSPRALVSGRDAAAAEAASFAVEEAVRLSLHPDGEVAYLTLPQGEGEAASFGGLASFTAPEAGTYQVGLSEPLWVDVVQNGAPAKTVRFGPGPACSGIRKAVTFELREGLHVIEISGGTLGEVGVVISRVR